MQITELCLNYMTYDPNYNYDDGDLDGDGGMETEEEGGEDEDVNDEYSDDDDMSWKVRRAAAKCLEAVISTRRDLLPELYRIVSPALIARFKGNVIFKPWNPEFVPQYTSPASSFVNFL